MICEYPWDKQLLAVQPCLIKSYCHPEGLQPWWWIRFICFTEQLVTASSWVLYGYRRLPIAFSPRFAPGERRSFRTCSCPFLSRSQVRRVVASRWLLAPWGISQFFQGPTWKNVRSDTKKAGDLDGLWWFYNVCVKHNDFDLVWIRGSNISLLSFPVDMCHWKDGHSASETLDIFSTQSKNHLIFLPSAFICL